MAWAYLTFAGIFEIVWAFAMKQSHGFTKLWPSTVMVVAMIASFVFLTLSMRSLPLGTAYTVWTGIGALGTFVLGIALLGEPVTLLRIGAAILIVSGLIFMKLA